MAYSLPVVERAPRHYDLDSAAPARESHLPRNEGVRTRVRATVEGCVWRPHQSAARPDCVIRRDDWAGGRLVYGAVLRAVLLGARPKGRWRDDQPDGRGGNIHFDAAIHSLRLGVGPHWPEAR